MKIDVKKRDHKNTPYFTVFATEGNKSVYLSAGTMKELNEKLVACAGYFGRRTVPILTEKE